MEQENTLTILRNRLDDIDSEIIRLYEVRMDTIKNVVDVKMANNIPVYDASRESSMLSKNLNKINKEEYKKYYESVLKGFLDASKAMQKDLLSEYKK